MGTRLAGNWRTGQTKLNSIYREYDLRRRPHEAFLACCSSCAPVLANADRNATESGERFLLASTDTSSVGTERFFDLFPSGDISVATAAPLERLLDSRPAQFDRRCWSSENQAAPSFERKFVPSVLFLLDLL